jgi:hypothetical protein
VTTLEEIIKINATTRTTSDGLAACLGLTRPRIIQLANEGVLSRDENSKYNVIENIKRYLAYRAESKGEMSFDNEKTLHEKAKRELAELDLAQKKKELHCSADIEVMVGGMITIFKRRMLGIPHKMANILAGNNADDVYDLLTNEIHSALTELAAFDVAKLGNKDDDDDTANR